MSALHCLAALYVLVSCGVKLSTQELPSECPTGRFGPGCQYACHCKGTHSCHIVTGSCTSGECAPGFAGDGCQNVNLAYEAKTPSRWLVDSDPTTCHAETGRSPHWIDLKRMFWLRRFRIIANDTAHTKKPISLQVSNSSNNAANVMSSSDVRVTWTSDGQIDVFLQAPVRGRYVWLNGKQLQLCEIYIYGGRNVALYRPTSQSSTRSSFTSSLAVDGMTSSDFAVSPCSHTLSSSGLKKFKELFKERGAWWRVNLTATHVITRIVIVNRAGHLNGMRYFNLRAGSIDRSNWRPVYQSLTSRPGPVIHIVPVTPLHLTLLQVELYGRQRTLTLCELQLFGDCPDMTYGPRCDNLCDCLDPGEVCDSFSGFCLSGKAGNPSTHSPSEDDDEEDHSGDTGDSVDECGEESCTDKATPDVGTAQDATPAVVAVLVVLALLAAIIVGVVVWCRQRKMRVKRRNVEMPASPPAPSGSAEDGVYEDLDSLRASSSGGSARQVVALTPGRCSFRKKIKQLALTSMLGRQRGAEQRALSSAGVESGGGAGVEGAAGGASNVYEPLGERDYDSLYSALNVQHYERPLQ